MSDRRTLASRWHRPAAAALALSPPVACAWYAHYSGRWDLFERTGSITAAIGLLLASRRHLQHGIAELASLQTGSSTELNAKDDVHSTKLGLALSAFGTVIWGWGHYLHWWSFGFISLWAMLVLRDIRRDVRYARRRALM